jgi:hypothetical protein
MLSTKERVDAAPCSHGVRMFSANWSRDSVSDLTRRVAQLEDAPGHACPECGLDPKAEVRYVIDWDWEEQEEISVSSPPCPRCGERAYIAVGWDGVMTDPDAEREKREHWRRLEGERAEFLASRPDLTGARSAAVTALDYPPSEAADDLDGRRGDRY